ncbi:hypothetical protein SDC9_150345 [bioreactor metagenome]|uniref:Uncharacterized protein n=1 Tax=bioreactor metagenome TaxID=1076179 RepID=A0A645EPC3_9ZZZZ
MYFQSWNAVNYTNTFFLQPGTPVNVGFLIKTCLKLHEHRDIFTIPCSIDKGIDHIGVFPDAVNGHFYTTYGRINRSFAQKINDVFKRLVRK